jgi:hypothetical protein|tara:strand:- start:259 stop:387 length:129 start_codon:yes stop_codon:yes gene_type:complete
MKENEDTGKEPDYSGSLNDPIGFGRGRKCFGKQNLKVLKEVR